MTDTPENPTRMTADQKDRLLSMTAAGSDRWEQQVVTHCHLMFARYLVEHRHIGEHKEDRR